jgi:hypothetical protein
LMQVCGSLSWIMVGCLSAQSWRTLTHPCAVAPCGRLWFDSVSSGVRRSSIPVDGLEVGSSSCLDASTDGGAVEDRPDREKFQDGRRTDETSWHGRELGGVVVPGRVLFLVLSPGSSLIPSCFASLPSLRSPNSTSLPSLRSPNSTGGPPPFPYNNGFDKKATEDVTSSGGNRRC